MAKVKKYQVMAANTPLEMGSIKTQKQLGFTDVALEEAIRYGLLMEYTEKIDEKSDSKSEDTDIEKENN